MRTINLGVFHCSATPEGKDLTAQDIRNMHIWPKDYFDKNENYLYTRYLGKKYDHRSLLPEEVRLKTGRGWSDIGYHHVIRLDGIIETGRPIGRPGAHIYGFNANSIGIVYIGGLDKDLKPKDTRTRSQLIAMQFLYNFYNKEFPGITWKGHRDFSPDLNNNGTVDRWEWIKSCPCFDVAEWIRNLKPEL